MAGWARKVGLSHEVNGFHHWSHLMILRGVTVKHELLCSHKPMGKDGGNCRKLCVQKGSRGRQWGFKPGSKSWLSVNELQKLWWSPRVLEATGSRFSASTFWAQYDCKSIGTRTLSHFLQRWGSQRIAPKELVGVHDGPDLSGWSPGWAKGYEHQFPAPCLPDVYEIPTEQLAGCNHSKNLPLSW